MLQLIGHSQVLAAVERDSQVLVRCGLLLCTLSKRSTAQSEFTFINGTRKQSTSGPVVPPTTSPPLIPDFKATALKKHVGA